MSAPKTPQQFKKGKKPGPGRPKGMQNKTTRLLKDAILLAAENAGNKVGSDGLVSYLEHQAQENPGPFLALVGKVLPMTVTGEGGGLVEVNVTITGHGSVETSQP
jgi:hypothetical protein